MKISTSILILLSACLLLPLRAQTTQDTTASDTTPTVSAARALPRNIMPWSTNHKPNPTNPPPEIAGPIDKFFKGLKAGNYADSYESFLAGTRLGAQKQKMSAMISRTEEGFGIYGKMNDYEIYDNYSVGSNVLILTYLARHDIQPLRWRFVFYRPDKTWQLNNMGFDDFLLDLLD
jgi:hypothetical protein